MRSNEGLEEKRLEFEVVKVNIIYLIRRLKITEKFNVNITRYLNLLANINIIY